MVDIERLPRRRGFLPRLQFLFLFDEHALHFISGHGRSFRRIRGACVEIELAERVARRFKSGTNFRAYAFLADIATNEETRSATHNDPASFQTRQGCSERERSQSECVSTERLKQVSHDCQRKPSARHGGS